MVRVAYAENIAQLADTALRSVFSPWSIVSELFNKVLVINLQPCAMGKAPWPTGPEGVLLYQLCTTTTFCFGCYSNMVSEI